MTKKVVFLDRESLDATVREFNFPHEYKEYESTWTPEEIVERLKCRDAIINKVPMRADTLKQLPDLKLIAVAATGTDVVDKAAAKAQGITVVNIRGYAFNTVPEHVVGLMFALRRAIVPYANSVRRGDWNKFDPVLLLRLPDLRHRRFDARHHRLRRAGQVHSQAGRGARMKVLAYDVFPQEGLVDLETILTQSDVITLHVPLTPDTRNMIGRSSSRR